MSNDSSNCQILIGDWSAEPSFDKLEDGLGFEFTFAEDEGEVSGVIKGEGICLLGN